MKTLPMRGRALQLESRGRLMSAEQIAELIGRAPAWVRKNVPNKIPLGYNTPRWYEDDVSAWIESKREERDQ